MTQDTHAKQATRDRVRALTANLSTDDRRCKSALACERLFKEEWFQRASAIMLYLPMPGEVDVTSIALRCFQTGRVVCVPRMDWDHHRMTPIEIRSFHGHFAVRRHGVREPDEGRPVSLDEIDLVVAPGLAFDADCHRLGRGGGFYDRFLAHPSLARAARVGICFDEQIVESTHPEPHDARLDGVLTDRRTVRTACPRLA